MLGSQCTVGSGRGATRAEYSLVQATEILHFWHLGAGSRVLWRAILELVDDCDGWKEGREGVRLEETVPEMEEDE